MRSLTSAEREILVSEFVTEAKDDLVGLWEIAKEVGELIGTGDVAREQSLIIVSDLLIKGMRAGNSPYHPGGYEPWSNQDRDVVLDRIRSEWIALGHAPGIPDIAWFDLPK